MSFDGLVFNTLTHLVMHATQYIALELLDQRNHLTQLKNLEEFVLNWLKTSNSLAGCCFA